MYRRIFLFISISLAFSTLRSQIQSPKFAWGIYTFQVGKNFAAMDEEGKLILPPVYTNILQMQDGMLVEQNGKMGFTDREGNLQIPCEFNWLGFMGRQREPAFKDGITIACSAGDHFFNGHFKQWVVKSKSWGLIDKKGKWIVPPEYEQVHRISPNCYLLRKAGQSAKLVDSTGQEYPLPSFLLYPEWPFETYHHFLFDLGEHFSSTSETENQTGIFIRTDEGVRLLRPNGTLHPDFRADEVSVPMISSSTQKLFFAIIGPDTLIYDPGLHQLPEPAKFWSGRNWARGFRKSKEEKLWGIEDTSGSWIFPPEFKVVEEIAPDYEQANLLGLKKDGKWIIWNAAKRERLPVSDIVNVRFDHWHTQTDFFLLLDKADSSAVLNGRTGEVILPFSKGRFKRLMHNNPYWRLESEEDCQVFRLDGQFLFRFPPQARPLKIPERTPGIVICEEEKGLTVRDTSGELIISELFNDVREEVGLIRGSTRNGIGVWTTSGKNLIPPKCEHLTILSPKVIAFEDENRIQHLVSDQGKNLLKRPWQNPDYIEPLSYVDETLPILILMEFGEFSGLWDEKGMLILPPEYYRIDSRKGFIFVDGPKEYGVMNAGLEWVIREKK